MGWNEKAGKVSRAFDQWKLTDAEIRRFLRFTMRVVSSEYDRLWEEVGNEPAYDDSADMDDIFHRRVGGLWPHDFEWMLLAAVWKDAVTAYEVYVENSLAEVLRSQGFKLRRQYEKWDKLTKFFNEYLEVDICPARVREIREIRHILTHNRGEWRTKEQRLRLSDDNKDNLPSFRIELTRGKTEEMCDTLAERVRSIDPMVYQYSWGRSKLNFPSRSG